MSSPAASKLNSSPDVFESRSVDKAFIQHGGEAKQPYTQYGLTTIMWSPDFLEKVANDDPNLDDLLKQMGYLHDDQPKAELTDAQQEKMGWRPPSTPLIKMDTIYFRDGNWEFYPTSLNLDELVIPEKSVTICFDWALTNPINIAFYDFAGFTRRKLSDIICRQ